MSRVEYLDQRGQSHWGPYPQHGKWNTPQGYRYLHPKYNNDPQYVDAWRQVRQDSLDAVLGNTTGIMASPIRIPANAPHRPPGGHRGEIGDPRDRTNYLDEPYEFDAVMSYINRTGWYSDANRRAREDQTAYEQRAKEFEDRIKAAEEAARTKAREEYISQQQALQPTQLIPTQQQSNVQMVPGINSMPPPWWGQQGSPPPQWTTGSQYYNPQGVRSGNMEYINARRGPQWYFGREGNRLQLDNLNI